MNENELTPTTGVYNGGDIPMELLADEYIDLEFQETYAARRQELIDGIMTFDDEPELTDDEIEGLIAPDLEAEFEYRDGGDTLLYGDWIKTNAAGEPDDDGKWEPDTSGEYALIYNVNENTAQVVWSRWVRYGKPASLCYPGQVDAEPDDPAEPEGEPGLVQPWDQMRATERRYVPYFALPEEEFPRD